MKRVLKSGITLCLTLALVLALVLGACSSPTATPTPTPSASPTTKPAASATPASSPTPAASVKPTASPTTPTATKPAAPPVPEFKLIFGSAATGSTGHLKSSLLANLISQKTGGKIRVSVIPTSGVPDAVNRLQNGEIGMMGTGGPPNLYEPVRGVGYREGMPPFQIYSLFSWGMSMVQTVMHADEPIEKWSDLAGKKIAGGTPGSFGAIMTERFLEVQGLTGKVEVLFLSFQAAIDALKDRKIAMSSMYTPPPNLLVTEFQNRNQIKLLDYDEKMIDDVAAKYSSGDRLFTLSKLTKASYPNLVRDGIQATSLQGVYVTKEFPEDVAYWLTRIFWDNIAELTKMHPSFEVDAEIINMVPQGLLPYHPGALKYYKEMGYLK